MHALVLFICRMCATLALAQPPHCHGTLSFVTSAARLCVRELFLCTGDGEREGWGGGKRGGGGGGC